MADTKISALDAAGTLDGTELIPVVKDGLNKSATPSTIKTFAVGNGLTVRNASTVANPVSTLVFANGTVTDGGDGTATVSGLVANPMTTGGDLIYGGASGVPTRLANGSAGQVLTSAGGTAAPTWDGVPLVTLTAAPADQSYSGEVISLTYGESIVPGDILYLKSDGAVWKADANAATFYPAIGLALETASSGSHMVLLRGIYRDDTRYAWTVGGVVYLSATAGDATQTAPSATDDAVQVLGVATHADRIYFSPSLNYITHT
jgi:hypothetical protein